MKKCKICNNEAPEEMKYCPECGEPFINYPPPAGFWIRVSASLIDTLVFIPVIILSFYNIFSIKSLFLFIILVIPGMLYKPFMESYYGATLGKMALGLKVIDERGNNLSLKAAYLRFVLLLLPSIFTIIGTFILFSSPEFLDASTLQEISRAKRSSFSGFINISKGISNTVVFIDCLFVAFSFRKRALHDMMAKSFCVFNTRNLIIEKPLKPSNDL